MGGEGGERESITKSKYVLYWTLFTSNFRPWGLCQCLPGRLVNACLVLPEYIYIYYTSPFCACGSVWPSGKALGW